MGVDQELAADQQPQLAQVQFRDQHFFITLEQLAQVRWQRIQIAQMGVGDRAAAAT